MDDYEIPPDTPGLWKAEVAFLKGALYERCISLIYKVQDLHQDYEIPDEIVSDVYKELGFIAGLLEDNYGFDGTSH